MNTGHTPNPEIAYWLVGAYTESTDQSEDWIREGIWRNGYGTSKFADVVRQIKAGDKIALKSTSVQTNNLPFDNHGKPASFMDIKAIGTVTAPTADGVSIQVQWEKVSPPRRWFHHTYRTTISQIKPDKQVNRDLIDFVFHGKPQDLSHGSFGSEDADDLEFESAQDPASYSWVEPYQRLADALLAYRTRRDDLVDKMKALAKENKHLSYLQDSWPDGRQGFPEDLDPFTVFSAFNRAMKTRNRISLFEAICSTLGVSTNLPSDFLGIPVKNLLNARFVWDSVRRGEKDIEFLWEIFESALNFADKPSPDHSVQFVQAFDRAMNLLGVNKGLTFGLFWIRPNTFVPLDQNMVETLKTKLQITIPRSGPKKLPTGSEYLQILEQVQQYIQRSGDPSLTIASLSHEAWQHASADKVSEVEDDLDANDQDSPKMPPPPDQRLAAVAKKSSKTYTLESITDDGCFVPPAILKDTVDHLRKKKNLILQGPPGTGKTWLAKRLAYAIVGSTESRMVPALQFHPNISYEDFVCGWRPGGGDGRLTLEEGPFLRAARLARELFDQSGDLASPVVLIIEEINRGNPAQIFGEMLTLLESTKRRPESALRLAHQRPDEPDFWLPPNFYLIGTMNVADRSLAIVDFALRRRFCYLELEPCFNKLWLDNVTKQRSMDQNLALAIGSAMKALNDSIAQDKTLGKHFQIGHSYFTPKRDDRVTDWESWYRNVVDMEIQPLLSEYWFDAPDRVTEEVDRLKRITQ